MSGLVFVKIGTKKYETTKKRDHQSTIMEQNVIFFIFIIP